MSTNNIIPPPPTKQPLIDKLGFADSVWWKWFSRLQLELVKYLPALGSANQLLGMNSAGTAVEFKTLGTQGVAGTLPAASGGTGFSSYAVGDILYANTTTTLAKLPDVAAGSFLRSGGTSTAPAWSTTIWTNSAAQGDLLYASAINTYINLNKDTNATRYLSNTGASNNPAWAQVALTTGVSGVLPVSNGGWGLATLTATSLYVGNGTSAPTALGSATNGQLPIGSTGLNPVLATITAGTGISITNGAGSITIATSGSSQASIQFKDEGSNLGTSGTADTVDFTGAGVTATRVSNTVTVNIPNAGTVTSVALAAPAEFTVSGSPVTTSGTLTFARVSGTANPILIPGGRITLSTATPVMTADVTAATTIYYALYSNDLVPIYDGTNWLNYVFTELSQTTTDTTKSPAAVAASKVYDMFVWNDSGTLRCTRGPAWSSDTSRGTGAGTSELIRQDGVWQNKVAITNGPGANRGTYVGSVRSNASSQIDWKLGSIAASGGEAWLAVWNMYNRVSVGGMAIDSTNNWSYGSAAWRSANASNTNRVSMLFGLNEDMVYAVNNITTNCAVSGSSVGGIGVDSTTAKSGSVGFNQNSSIAAASTAHWDGFIGLGFHFIQAIEYSAGGSAVFYGDSGVDYIQSGLHVMGRF